MAASTIYAGIQKTQDIDVLSVRTIFAKGDKNSIIPANSFLGTDGKGGTRWVDISTIKNGITFNTFATSQSTFTSGPESSKFSILDGDNVGLTPADSGNTVKLYSKAFGKIDVIGQDSIYSYDAVTGLVNSNIQLAGTGIVNISTDTTNNLINIYSPNDATSSMSTVVGNFTGLNSFLTNVIPAFNSPFSTFIYSSISSFSTAQGRTINTRLFSNNLQTSTLTMSGVRQPFVQYGIATINPVVGFNLVTLPTSYTNANFSVQLTYSRASSNPQLLLTYSTANTRSFRVQGDLGATFSWTTYGNVF
jgi:hypothetical protein